MTTENAVIAPGSASAGQFVKTLQGATGVGFAEGFHVHKDWIATCKTYDQAMEALESARGERVDILTPRKNIMAEARGKDCVILIDGKPHTPTPHAMKQMAVPCRMDSKFLIDFMSPIMKTRTKDKVREEVVEHERDEQDAQVLADVLNNGFRRIDPDKKYRVRTYSDGTMRAFLTESYAEIDNRHYLEIIRSIIPDGMVSHFRGDADEIWANILIPDTIMDYPGDDSDYGGMITCSNSEIGSGSVNQSPSTFRSICLNGCIWGQSEGTKGRWVHRGDINYDELKKAVNENITTQIPLLTQFIDAMHEAKTFTFGNANLIQIIAAIAKANHITRQQAVNVVMQYNMFEHEHRNAFGVLNAFTRAGQFENPRTCIRFDGIGGSLANPKTWAKFTAMAETIDEEDILSIFGNGLKK
jgi:hypothetical protein